MCGRAEERTHALAHARKYGTTTEKQHFETKRAEPRRAPRVAATARLPELALFECEQETQTKQQRRRDDGKCETIDFPGVDDDAHGRRRRGQRTKSGRRRERRVSKRDVRCGGESLRGAHGAKLFFAVAKKKADAFDEHRFRRGRETDIDERALGRAFDAS